MNYRDEEFTHMIRFNMCPHFKAKSLTTALMLIYVTLFVIMASINGIQHKEYFLEIENIKMFGSRDPYLIKYEL